MKATVHVLNFSYYSFFGEINEIAGVFSSKELAESAAKELETQFHTE